MTKLLVELHRERGILQQNPLSDHTQTQSKLPQLIHSQKIKEHRKSDKGRTFKIHKPPLLISPFTTEDAKNKGREN